MRIFLRCALRRDEWRKQAEIFQAGLEKTQKKAKRKERQLRAILAAAEAEREYLRSLYNGSLVTISNSAMRVRDGAAVRDYEVLAAEARCVGMEDEIRRLRAENEALRAHVSAMSLAPHGGFQLRPGPPGYDDREPPLLTGRGEPPPRRADAGRGSPMLQLTGEEEAAPFSCSTSPIPKEPGWTQVARPRPPLPRRRLPLPRSPAERPARRGRAVHMTRGGA